MKTTFPLRPLERVFRPRSVAVIGASERAGSVGSALCRNILSGGFGGPIHLVNPKHAKVFGQPCAPSLQDLPGPPDLAVVATPARTIPSLVKGLGEIGAGAAVILTAATKSELDQDAVAQAAGRRGMRIIGPNCIGVLSPHVGLNASFAHLSPQPGRLAFLSQSGAILTSVLDWAVARGIGFSAMVSTGNSIDVHFDELIDYFAADRQTSAIMLYAESIRKAAAFMSAARRAARVKPVIVMKTGRHDSGVRAAVSHTGALAGSDAVCDAAFRRAGLVRVLSLEELFDAAEILSTQPPLAVNSLAIVTNGGGAGVIAADCLADAGGQLAELSPATVELLGRTLPPTWSRANPIDIVGDADGDRYRGAVRAVLDDPQNDAVLVVRCPTSIASAEETARAVIETVLSARLGSANAKPVLTCWLGEATVAAARTLFENAKLPTFESPEDAIQAAAHMTAYAAAQETIMRMPAATDQDFPVDRKAAARLIGAVQTANRTVLTEVEAKELLTAYGIPTVPTRVARTPEEAGSVAATMLGGPNGRPRALVLKVVSPEITHKSDVGGVRLDVRSADDARRAATEILAAVAGPAPEAVVEGVAVQPMIVDVDAQELIVGIARDAAFGPVALFGAGGTAAEVLNDKAVDLPPLDDLLAKAMIARTRVARLLAGYRQRPPANVDKIAETLIRIARLAADFPELIELDVNPLLADSNGVIALDARAVIAPADEAKKEGEHLAIAPYPDGWKTEIDGSKGCRFIVRPILPTDEALFPKFVERLEPEDIRLRLFAGRSHFGHEDFARWAQIDYRREMTFVAVGPSGGDLLGFVQLAQPEGGSAEFGILVRSDVQGRGIGFSLMQQMIAYGRARGVSRLHGEILPENACMRSLCRAFGFKESSITDGVVVACLDLEDRSGQRSQPKIQRRTS